MKKECENGQNLNFRAMEILDGLPELIEIRQAPRPANGAGRRIRDRVEVLFDGKSVREMSTSQNDLIDSPTERSILPPVPQPHVVEPPVSLAPLGNRRFSLPTELAEKLSTTNLRDAYSIARAMRSGSWPDFVDCLHLSQQDIEALDKAVVDYQRNGKINTKKY